jgi:dTDP-4-dehydrorhamnose reductase
MKWMAREMPPSGRIAVTGSGGRLGRALASALAARDVKVIEWSRPDYDLDDPSAASRLVARDQPTLVLHPAAWTDVDGCARQPGLAMRRNATAVGELAQACALTGAGLVLISTNEVFDGRRADGQGYVEDDATNPPNPYGASKLAGEQQAQRAYGASDSAARLWIVRTAWLYGPPGNDFPTKIVAAADRLPAGQPLKVVADEVGSPSYTLDLAGAIIHLAAVAPGGTYHLAGAGTASRFELAEAVLGQCRPGVPLVPISGREFVRASVPPPWAVLDCSRAAGFGVVLRPWRDALADYLNDAC